MTFKTLRKRIILLAAIGIVLISSIMSAPSLDINTDRPGSDYKNFDLASADPNLCASACSGDPDCQAFSYNPPGMSGPSAKCYLKNEVPQEVAAAGVVSGVRETVPLTTYLAGSAESKYSMERPIDFEQPGSSNENLISYEIGGYTVTHYAQEKDIIADIQCFSVNLSRTIGSIYFVNTSDGTLLPENRLFQLLDGSKIIRIYYPYSRYNDISDLLKNGKEKSLNIDGNNRAWIQAWM